VIGGVEVFRKKGGEFTGRQRGGGRGGALRREKERRRGGPGSLKEGKAYSGKKKRWRISAGSHRVERNRRGKKRRVSSLRGERFCGGGARIVTSDPERVAGA